MIRLHVHGAIEMEAADGRSLLSVLSQPKRTALLAYLVLADPGRFQRRDTLLALFWPELDESRARNALSQALHHLRRSLGEGVIVSRGEGEVGVAAGALWCDAVAFEQALEGGRLEEALELYRGEILAGLNLGGTPEFERWLDAVRVRARERAAQGAWQLAEGAERAGDMAGAAARARHAAGLQQDDEAALRRLLAFLDRIGDRAGALHAYETFTRRLEAEQDAEPSPRTRALIEEIRSRASDPVAGGAGDEGAVPAPVAPRASEDAPHSATLDGARRVSAESAARVSRPRRLSPAIALTFAAVALLGSVAFLPAVRRAIVRPAAATSVSAVAVFPFDIQGSDELGYLGRGMTDLLSAKLDGAGGLRSVDPRAVLGASAARAPNGLDLRQAEAISARIGADLFIMGSLVAHSGHVQVSASLYTPGEDAPLGRAAVEGPVEQIFELVDRLAAELLVERQRGPGAELTRLAAMTTPSLPALKAYLEGESAMRAGRYALARETFREATTLDTAFALAYYRLGVAAVWDGEGSQLPHWAVQRAIQHGDRLSERARLLLRAFNAYIGRDAVEAERLYQSVLATHPDDVEAWYHMGEVRFHYGPLLGAPLEEAAEPFERVLRFEPKHGEALVHLARVAARQRELPRFDSLIARLPTGSGDQDLQLELRALQLALRRDSAEWGRFLVQARQLGDLALLRILFATAAHGAHPAAALDLAHLLTHPNRSPSSRGIGYGMAAQLELARGRWRGAREELEALARLEPASALLIASLFAASPLTPATPAEVEALRARSAAIDSTVPASALQSLALAPVYLPFLRHYLAGLLSTRLGDLAGAQAHVRALEDLGGAGPDPELGHGLARSIGAASAWQSGDASGAYRALAQVPLGPQQLKAALGYSAQGYERFLFGEVLAAEGKDDEALRWYGSFPEPAGYDLIYLAPSHLRRAELYERRGERARAALHYARFVELWEEADPELRPMVEAARARLMGLRG